MNNLLIHIVYALPLAFREPSWSFEHLHLLPLIQKSAFYTPQARDANVHILPHRSPYNSTHEARFLYDWLEAEYEPWKNASNRFYIFNLCDHVVNDCQFYKGDQLSAYPQAIQPQNPKRRLRYIVWNGLADGADSKNGNYCSGCIQAGKDVVIPTAQNACGPLCGSNLDTLRRFAVWNADAPNTIFGALDYVKRWEERPHTMFWAGQVSPRALSPDFDANDDISGRGAFWQAHHNRPGWSLHQTYDWAANKPAPLGVSMLEMMRNSTFCYNPLGHVGGDADRYIPALLTGCVPVVLRTVRAGTLLKYRMPFEDVLEWNKVAVIIDAHDVPRLHEILAERSKDLHSLRAHAYSFWRRMLYTQVYGAYLSEGGENDALQVLFEVLDMQG